MDWRASHPAYEHLIAALVQDVDTTYVVGGAVRDFLVERQRRLADLDIVVGDNAIPVARRLADRLGWAFYPMDPVRDVGRLVFVTEHGQNLICDISRIRGSSIADDLAARDFTVNAMAVRLQGGKASDLLDLHGGRDDLERRQLRRVTPLSLLDDPVRLLRAVRLIAQLGLSLEDATRAQIERLADTVRLCSPERARDELWRMLCLAEPHRTIDMMDDLGLLMHVLPEVAKTKGVEQTAPHHEDVYSHTLSVVEWAGWLRDWLVGRPLASSDSVPAPARELFASLEVHKYKLRRHFSASLAADRSRADWQPWYALMHDVGKPYTATMVEEPDQAAENGKRRMRFLGHEDVGAELATARLERLRFSRYEISASEALIHNHMRLHNLHHSFPDGDISRRAAYRFFRDIGGRQFGRGLAVDAIMLALADYLATHRELLSDWPEYLAHANQLLDDYFSEDEEESTAIEPLVDGYDLMQHLDVRPGRTLGRLLTEIKEAQAAGEVTTAEEAIELARRLRKNGTE